MIKIKILTDESRNRKPIEKVDVQHTPTKISGFGASDEYTKTAGHDHNPISLPRYAMEDGSNHEEKVKYFDILDSDEEEIELPDETLYEKKDRCYHLAKRKYKVFPSAYASGFIVRCRKGKVGRKRKKKSKKEESLELDLSVLEEDTFIEEEKEDLSVWFGRRGEKGKKKGWIDCNTCRKDPETGRKTCKSCGRGEGEKRSKYPACRPTPSACTRSGTSKKKSSSRVSWKPKKKEEE